ncbi:replication factor C subunit 3-like [Brevipalpus obovatus]|uniref:replication factor C subunit 3-like n=1 Tax=Brevipalpus obovatus TaxID=246614 RepID=UPI003D9DBD7B
MALWCDKYRPNSLSKLDYNKDQAEYIRRMIKGNDFPHLLIYGAPGSGKRTRVQCILRELFGNSVDKTRIEHSIVETPSKKKLELNVITSNYHVEVNPSDLGIYDRLVIQDVMKNIAQSGGLVSSVPFKVVVVSDAHRLSREAQHSLRRTMEKYYSTLRLIMCGDTSSTILPPIKSRCLLLRVAAPSVERITGILTHVAKKENFSIDYELVKKIAIESGRNLRRALLMMETMHINGTKEIIKPSHVLFIQNIAKKMTENPSLDNIREIREDYYELESHLIPSELIFIVLIKSLISMDYILDERIRAKLLKLASHYEYQMRIGNKRILHFEAFATHFMSINETYREDLVKMLEDDIMEI